MVANRAKLKLAVLISGRGSNLQSLIDACDDADYPVEIVTVVSNVPGVQGLDKAEAAGIETTVIDHTAFDGREAFENALHDAISASGAEFVCLAGFMRMLTGGFVGKWRDRMINIHPSLLPDYKGLHVHERVVEAGEKFSGCTVHFVVPDLDSGPIIVQAKVPVEPGDDADTLAARVLDEEHKILPEAVRLIAEDRVSVDGDRVIIT
ncbi:MAG: phosphoribosylglycinamide formyltransferase [Rhodospirillaceae bacterium]|jgi:phosphoribosylglycinamide formyltransferase 1|nr:phosphoribosylglycinamide formyltransferase [Rhodospirillaceae bacterium]MBT4219934.1 phosphoribosylglycinamide formyltransferase [Rhodospirillaceae bacterium]MBT5014739.1 phosphoribosylglycinamide formyltransferase [Rhodospirillaceae bacterium]MBT5309431.1 phosphoribosylglycinamide formyltransferase [Rhodospirillaceae bacterium]MBT7355157.1 phosphoribosylglycinamide formyltransferase [Rhodospirillaceae bacterium]